MISGGGRISAKDFKGSLVEKRLTIEIVSNLNELGFLEGEELRSYISDCYMITRIARVGRQDSGFNVDKVYKYIEKNVLELREFRRRKRRKNK